MRLVNLLCFVLLVAIGVVGCDSNQPNSKDQSPNESPSTKSASTSPKSTSPKSTDLESTATASTDPASADLSGRITLKGDLPPARKLSITKDAEVCGAVDTIVDVVGVNGGVADVVIQIKGVTGESWTYQDPPEGYVMRQKDCQFHPGLLVIPNGKDIKVYNDDPIGHNVNTGDWNQMQPAGPEPIVRPVESKSPTKIGCNIHSWMEAWIYPVDNPYFAVTDQNGNFTIAGIPPGKYRVNIWHAALGRKTARMTFVAGKSATLDHEFESR